MDYRLHRYYVSDNGSARRENLFRQKHGFAISGEDDRRNLGEDDLGEMWDFKTNWVAFIPLVMVKIKRYGTK